MIEETKENLRTIPCNSLASILALIKLSKHGASVDYLHKAHVYVIG